MTQQEIIDHTLELIKIESTANNLPGLQAAVDFVTNILSKCEEITIERFEQNGKPSILAYLSKNRPKRFDVLLCAHVDVVPAKPEQFVPSIKGNKMYGRGAYDMKLATIIMTDAFIATIGRTDKKVGLMVVSDEEVGGFDGMYVQLQQGVATDFGIYGEMTDLEICTETRGMCWVDMTFPGITSHSGYPWDGKNAITKAGEFIRALLDKYPVPKNKEWRTTVSISSITTPNDTYNTVPDTANLKLDFRFTPEDRNFRSKASIKEFLESIGFDAQVTSIPIRGGAVSVSPSNVYLNHFMDTYERRFKKEPTLIKRYASSDTRHMAEKNMPCIEIGLSGGSLHGDKEYVDLAGIQPYKELLVDFLVKPLPAQSLRPKALEATQITLLRQLIGIKTSDNTHEAERALNFVRHYLEERGMHIHETQQREYNVLATTHPTKKPKVLFVGHVDVLKGDHKLFAMREQDGRLYGRGVWSMKDAVANYLALVDELRDNLDEYDFGILISANLTNGDLAIKDVIQTGFRPESVVSLNGGEDWQMESIAKSNTLATITAYGLTAHGSRPWMGESATLKIHDILTEVRNLFGEKQEPLGNTLNISAISAGGYDKGVGHNQVPAEASASLDIRTMSDQEAGRLQEAIKDICKKYGAVLRIENYYPVLKHETSEKYHRAFAASIERVTGIRNKGTISYGSSQSLYFALLGIPTVLSRPTGGDRLSDNEWVDKASFLQTLPILCDFIKANAQKKSVRLVHKIATAR